MNKRVLLIGPSIGVQNVFYGGGVGGYTRNMSLYISDFKFKEIDLIPCFCTNRKKNQINFISFPCRFFQDLFRVLWNILFNHIDAIHILGRYRSALILEVTWIILAKILNKKVIYDIKAGIFIDDSEKNLVHKTLSKYILNSSDVILAEGKIYLDYVYTKTGKTAIHFPNVVSRSEIPPLRKVSIGFPLRILFVGYCYYAKGIFELVKAIEQAAKPNFSFKLEIIGEESKSFSNWIENRPHVLNVEIIRYGKRSHEFVLERMKENDIYAYPSKHIGEGHNNSINEAMMNSLIIISSKNGFLEDVLQNCGILIDIDNKDENMIVNDLKESFNFIVENQDVVVSNANNGRKKIETLYNSNIQGKVLEKEYKKIFNI